MVDEEGDAIFGMKLFGQLRVSESRVKVLNKRWQCHDEYAYEPSHVQDVSLRGRSVPQFKIIQSIICRRRNLCSC